jgi:hypothetical protein
LRVYAVKTELVSTTGQHVRYVPGPMAQALVAAGHAEIAHQNGRVKAVKLLATAATHARMIGPPTDGLPSGVRFTRWVRLDGSATRVVEHHRRATDYE